jgi:ribosomal protein S18 acetylase RimI-like enzyme
VPEDQQGLVARLQQDLGPGRVPGIRYLALDSGVPVRKGYLSLAGPDGVGAIFGMSVVPEARGRGIASGLADALLARARAEGCTRVVLHSTPGAVGMYRRAGFAERCALGFHATTALLH